MYVEFPAPACDVDLLREEGSRGRGGQRTHHSFFAPFFIIRSTLSRRTTPWVSWMAFTLESARIDDLLFGRWLHIEPTSAWTLRMWFNSLCRRYSVAWPSSSHPLFGSSLPDRPRCWNVANSSEALREGRGLRTRPLHYSERMSTTGDAERLPPLPLFFLRGRRRREILGVCQLGVSQCRLWNCCEMCLRDSQIHLINSFCVNELISFPGWDSNCHPAQLSPACMRQKTARFTSS